MPVSNERNGTFLGPGSAPLMASNQSWIVVQQLESDSEGCWCPGWEKFECFFRDHCCSSPDGKK